MTVNSAAIGADWFLNGIANLQARELLTQQQLSSGYAVSTAADDPAATQQLVDLGSSLAAAQAYQTNLTNVQAEASAADTAIGYAVNLLQSAQSLATQGASSTASATVRQNLATQVQAIQQQVVSLANTTIAGRYVFGGDQEQSAPYQYDASSAEGVDALTSAVATKEIVSPSGESIYQPLAAGAIFDPQSGGQPAGTNTFAALQNLQSALATNNTAGITAALAALGTSTTWLNQQQVHYGTAEQVISSQQNAVAGQITQIQSSISSIRDANIAQAATDLTQESTDQQAAMAAEAELPQKSLFDYLA